MKKHLAMLFAAVCLLLSVLPMTAAAAPGTEGEIVIHLDDPQRIEPRLKYLSAVFTNLSIDGNGTASCMGNYSTATSRQIRLRVALQRCRTNSSNDSDWSDVQSWTNSWNTPGTYALSRTTSVSSGWYYRVQTTATVLDSNGITLEKVTVCSLAEWY